MAQKESNPALIYILAPSHSGSTLTAMLLNAHPEICTAGELKIGSLGDPGNYRCSCRNLLRKCEFWDKVRQSMADRGIDFDVTNSKTGFQSIQGRFHQRLLRPLHRGKFLELCRDAGLMLSPCWRAVFSDWSHRNRALIESIRCASAAKFVVDSSKTAVRLKFLRRIDDLEIKVVRLRRDGRATALTYIDSDNFADARDPCLRGGGTGNVRTDNLNMTEAAKRWLESNREADRVLATIPATNKIEISYEGLCERTDHVMDSVHRFLGIEKSTAHRKFRDAEHHVIGNGMRLDNSSEVKLDDRWKAVLTANELAEFDRVAGHLNRQYGYE